jgi:Tol biopolymer transport system component
LTAERWAQIKEIFLAAMEEPAAGLSAFLEKACRGDSALRHEVETLLNRQDAPTLGSPAEELLNQIAAAELAPGQALAQYRIEAKLGEGGMGAVYLAHDTRLRREVALKVLPQDRLADPEAKRRLLREARSASALNHPNIVTVHEIGSEGGVDFITMEFVEGESLRGLIQAGRLPLGQALNYAVQIAGGLAKAHSAGIIHRDLKPGNIMVRPDGTVKLLDFGLAQRLQPSGSESTLPPAEGVIAGTPAYMSPEQAQGKDLDARSDIFSFGAVLYEMLTSCRAFPGDSQATMIAAILKEEPKPLGPEVPKEVERLVSRCLRKDPNRRFQDMVDLKIALEDLQAEFGSGRSVRGGDRIVARRGRRILVGAACFAGLAACGAGLWFFTTRSESSAAEPRVVPLTAYPGLAGEASFSPHGNQVAFSWNGETQDNFDIYVKLIDSPTPLRLTTDPADDFHPAWSPDGKSIAFERDVGEANALILIPAIGGPEREVARLSPSVSSRLSWSPDGKWLAVAESPSAGQPSSLFLLSPVTGEKRSLMSPPPSAVWGDGDPAFSPDGRKLAFRRSRMTGMGEIAVLSLTSELRPQGDPVELTHENGWLAGPVWTRDGREIVCTTGNGMALDSLWRLSSSGGRLKRLEIGTAGLAPVISRDGKRLAFTKPSFDPNIWRAQIAGQGPRAVPAPLLSSSRLEVNAQYSPDGKRIAFESDRSGSFEIWTSDSDGAHAVQVTTLGKSVSGTPRWSPDGGRIAFDWNVAGHWDIYTIGAGGGGLQRMTTEPFDHAIPSYSRDGKWLYFASMRSGRYEVWKMPAGGGGAVQVTRTGGLVAFESVDGKWLYYTRSDSTPSLWKMPAGGGDETQVVPEVLLRAFAIADHGIYFIPPPRPNGHSSVEFLSFSSGAIRTVLPLVGRTMWGLSVSPNNRFLIYTQLDQAGSDLMLMENFR